MPRRTDISHVLVIGSGPIVIGQACEFDYSGTQACRVLKSEGLRVSLVNSNPATIMTDPEFADATYIEPITAEYVEKVIEAERDAGHPIDAVLATLGGQTALNTAVALHDRGSLEKYDIELIGADFDAIQRGEDRQMFKDIVEKVGGESARSRVCHTMDEVRETVAELGFPVVVRPSFTMGGLGSGMAYDDADLERIAGGGLAASPTANVLIEESILGWKEYELELMRDNRDNVVVICSIENVDPVGVHTGDSVTVAPAMTLTDVEYQKMRDLSIAILREVGVDTGGCNIQFAQDPQDGRLVVADAWHHRLLIWDHVPQRSGQVPDEVIGQSDPSGTEPNRGRSDPDGTGFHWPYGVAFVDGGCWVADTGNRRVLGWRGLPQPNQPAVRSMS